MKGAATMERLADMQTGILGGVESPTKKELSRMQQGPYVLRARGGRITEVPSEKAKLPHDPKGHPQGANVALINDGTLYVAISDGACISKDGGRTWTLQRFAQLEGGHWKPLDDGTLITATMDMGDGATGPVKVSASRDGGQTGETVSEFPVDWPGGYRQRYSHWGLHRLPDETLVYGMDIRGCVPQRDAGHYPNGLNILIHFQSRDGGMTWEGPFKVTAWGSEGGITVLPSGRWLATVRYQGRPDVPSDPPDLRAKLGANPDGGLLYKHVFLADSGDRGRTWHNLRQLCTVLGQCYGYPVALEDGTVVVAHDTRYGPGEPSGRAMASHDEGQTWEDEAYYLYYGMAQSGYSQSVVLDDGTVLTVAGTSDRLDGNAGDWNNWTGHSDLTAIRWKPVR